MNIFFVASIYNIIYIFRLKPTWSKLDSCEIFLGFFITYLRPWVYNDLLVVDGLSGVSFLKRGLCVCGRDSGVLRGQFHFLSSDLEHYFKGLTRLQNTLHSSSTLIL